MTISPIQQATSNPVPLQTTAVRAPLLSASAPRGTESPGGALLSALTPSDRSLIAAATGVVISPSGSIVSGAGYVSSGSAASVEDFAFVIAAARTIGSIQGRITPQSLAKLFPPYITEGSPALSTAVKRAAQLLATAPGSSAFDTSA